MASFRPAGSKISTFLLIGAIVTALVLSTGGCSPVSNDDTGRAGSSTEAAEGPEEPADTTPGNSGAGDESAQALEMLYEWQPEWRELCEAGRRPVEDGFATMVIELTEQPEEGSYTFHVYDLIELPDEEGHTATYGWFEVRLETGEIYDLVMDEPVN